MSQQYTDAHGKVLAIGDCIKAITNGNEGVLTYKVTHLRTDNLVNAVSTDGSSTLGGWDPKQCHKIGKA